MLIYKILGVSIDTPDTPLTRPLSGEGLQSHRSAERARQLATKCDVLWGNGKSHILHSSGKVVYEMRSAHHIHVTYYTSIIVLDIY